MARWRYTDEQVFDALREVAAGGPLSRLRYRDQRKPGMPAMTTIEQRYGGWERACRAAGVEPVMYRTKDRMHSFSTAIEGLVLCGEELRHRPAPDDYAQWQREHRRYPSLWTLCQRWGWANAIEQAGF